MSRITAIIFVGVACGLLSKKLNLPGGTIVGSMLGAAFIGLLAPGVATIPPSMATAIELIIGISLGLSFDRGFLPLVSRLLPAAILSTVGLLLTSVLMALVAKRLGIVDFVTALFGFAPGGMAGMGLLAQAEGSQTSIVIFFHSVRLFVLFVFVPIMARYFL